MGMSQMQPKWDDEFEEAKAKLREARREEERARDALAEARLLQDREERFQARAERSAVEARNKESDARRKAEDARRRIDEARRRGQGRHRWEAELRRWESEGQRAAQDIRRYEDEGRRKERDAKAAAKEVKVRAEVVTQRLAVSHDWQQRMKFLTTMKGRSRPAEAPGQPDGADTEEIFESDSVEEVEVQESEDEGASNGEADVEKDGPKPLEITARAAASLRATLEDMQRGPHQLLRLSVDGSGSVVLYLDTARQSDHVVDLEGSAVLLIDTPVLEGLVGSRLDVSETPEGASLVLS